MKNISIIYSSVRERRKSHRVALYFKDYIEENNLATVKILDLKSYNFPIFEERLSSIKEPTKSMISFSGDIIAADGVIIVTPEIQWGVSSEFKKCN